MIDKAICFLLEMAGQMSVLERTGDSALFSTEQSGEEERLSRRPALAGQQIGARGAFFEV